MEAKTVKFTQEKETRNTVRFAEQPEEGQPTIIGSLYVSKAALGTPPPAKLVVTITGEA
jgi:hypothetical protein